MFVHPENHSQTLFNSTLNLEEILSGYAIALIIIAFVGTLANFGILLSILVSPKLRNESLNLMIVSICLADLVILLLDRPFLIYLSLNHNLREAVVFCSAQTFFESFGFAVQMVNMGVLGFERWLSISRPLEVSEKRQRILHFICYSWVFGVACGLGAIFAADKSFYFRICRQMPMTAFGYFDYLTIPLGALTTVFIAAMYALIMRLVSVHAARMKSKNTGPLELSDASKPNSLTSNITSFFANYSRRIAPASNELAPPLQPTAVEVFDAEGNKTLEVVVMHNNAGAVCKFTPKNREVVRRKMEVAAAKKSMAVVTSFFVCWLPLPICHQLLRVKLDDVLWWHFLPLLTLTLTAVVNPVVYAFVNKRIRRSGIDFVLELIESVRPKTRVSA